MDKDFLQQTNFGQEEEHESSQSELAARAWTNRLGDSPIEFYQMVSVEGQAAIRKSLQDELTKLHAEQQKLMAERESVLRQRQEKAMAERENMLKKAEQTKRAEQWREAKLDREVTDDEKQYANELAKQAWKNITDMTNPLAHQLTPGAEALKVQEFNEEVGKIRAEDERDFTADQKREILENPSEKMREAYRDSVHDRACKVFEGRWHNYEDFKPEYKDQLLTHWQEEMISLRDKDRSAEQSKDVAERASGSGIGPTTTDMLKAEGVRRDGVRDGVRDGAVKESSNFTYEQFVDVDKNALDRTAFSEIKAGEIAQELRVGGGYSGPTLTIAHELLFGDEPNISVSVHQYERSRSGKELEEEIATQSYYQREESEPNRTNSNAERIDSEPEKTDFAERIDSEPEKVDFAERVNFAERMDSEAERVDSAERMDSAERVDSDSERVELDVAHEDSDSDGAREIAGAEKEVRGGIDEAILGGSGVEVRSELVHELKGVKEIQESVSKWWNRENSKTPFGPEIQVIDYPRAPGSEWNVEDYDREFDLYFEFEHGPDAIEIVQESMQERGAGASASEHDINRLLFDDGQSFDQVNRPYGQDSHDDNEHEKDDNLEFERSDWSERGR